MSNEDTKGCTRMPAAAAARALCNHHAELCGVNADDQWAHYSEDFLADVQIVMPHLQVDAQALIAELRAENEGLTERYECNTSIMHARTEALLRVTAERDALRAKLRVKPQAAPERGVVLPERANENEGNAYAVMQAMARNQALDEVARLNPALAAQPVADVRQAFEGAMRADGYTQFERNESGTYRYDDINELWRGFNLGWQARAALSPAEQPGLSVPDALREAVEYLDSNPFNEIGAGSILHRAMRDAIAAAPSTSDKAKGE